MTAVLKACGIVVIGLFAALIFRESGKTVRFAVIACAFLSVVTFFISGGLSDSFGMVFSEAESYFPDYAKILLKALGISYITAVTGEICTGAGEETLANAAAFAGKVQIILLCVPMIEQLLKIAGDTL